MTVIAIERRAPLSIGIQTLATFAAIAAAVVVPQFFHMLGTVSGAGAAPAVAFCPMHLPILVVGFLAGPWAGALAGLGGPVAAHFLSGMPPAAQLPFMMVELFGYGLAAGLLRNVKLPLVANTLLAMVFGRVLRMLACTLAFYALGMDRMAPLGIWRSLPLSLPGIVLQLVLVPLVVYRVEKRGK